MQIQFILYTSPRDPNINSLTLTASGVNFDILLSTCQAVHSSRVYDMRPSSLLPRLFDLYLSATTKQLVISVDFF